MFTFAAFAIAFASVWAFTVRSWAVLGLFHLGKLFIDQTIAFGFELGEFFFSLLELVALAFDLKPLHLQAGFEHLLHVFAEFRSQRVGFGLVAEADRLHALAVGTHDFTHQPGLLDVQLELCGTVLPRLHQLKHARESAQAVGDHFRLFFRGVFELFQPVWRVVTKHLLERVECFANTLFGQTLDELAITVGVFRPLAFISPLTAWATLPVPALGQVASLATFTALRPGLSILFTRAIALLRERADRRDQDEAEGKM